jgi:hypothetical protein
VDKKVDAYIEKQPSPQKEICQSLRALTNKTFPGVKEEMKWGVPVFADGKYYITALKNDVNLGFKLEGLTKEEEKLFEGGGKTMKHIKVARVDEIDEKRIVAMLKLVDKRTKTG